MLGQYTGRVGLFSSPHLARFTERYQIYGEAIEDEEISECIESLEFDLGKDLWDELTFFEISALVAIRLFVDRKVNVAVLEVKEDTICVFRRRNGRSLGRHKRA